MRRANKAEDRRARDRAKPSGMGRGRGAKSTQDPRPLQSSVEHKGGRRTPPHLRGVGSRPKNVHGVQGTSQGKSQLPDSMKARLTALDDDDDYFTI